MSMFNEQDLAVIEHILRVYKMTQDKETIPTSTVVNKLIEKVQDIQNKY